MSNIFIGSIKASEIKAGEISFITKEAAELQEHRQIGTVEECREARKRQAAISPVVGADFLIGHGNAGEPIFEHENEFPF